MNFDGRFSVIPLRYIQQTPVMMIGAAVQAAAALAGGQAGILDLDERTCCWVDKHFPESLGEDARYLDLPPDEAW